MFTHLHVHSEYSLLDGLCKIPAIMDRVKDIGQEAVALTDHGVLYGAIQFYKEALSRGIKPIIGIEAYLAGGSRHSREAKDKQPFHMTILAKDATGYRNLVTAVTKAHLEGYYYKPRLDRDLLEKYGEGLVALSGCNSSEIARLLEENRVEEASRAALYYKDIFGDFFIEIQDHGIEGMDELNKKLVQLARDTELPLVATNDVHYVNKADSKIQDILLCIGTNSAVSDERRMRMAGAADSYYLKSEEEMRSTFPELPEAFDNSWRIAEMCDLSLEFGSYRLPEADIPAGLSAEEHLAQLCRDGLYRRYQGGSEAATRRLDYELAVVRTTGFSQYILVVYDIAHYAREQGIMMAVRGSAAASIILYCLGVTDIDPLANRLVFERFIHDQRREMPDVDLDFAEDRRDEMIRYAAQKYGADRVAQIITFGTLGAKASIRDVGRALGMSYSDVDRVARLIPNMPPSFGVVTIDRALQESADLRQIQEDDSQVRHLIETAKALEGVARHASTHAAGVVIAPEPLACIVPLQRPTSGDEMALSTTQYAMNDVADLGLLKMDFLGLTNLTILEKAIQVIGESYNVDLDIDELPEDDIKTYDMLSRGETFGVFQMESAGMRRYVQELRPTSVRDLAAMVALYRPGPMQHIPAYIRAKHGEEEIRYPHQDLSELLDETYGIIVYQDQVLLIAQKFAGYTLGQADVMRKAMGKKIPEVMSAERERFVNGAQERGYSARLAEQIFNLIEPFAGYAFNKAHAVSYAVITYQTAFLKANFPEAYMTALLSMADQSRITEAYSECARLGIRVFPPSVNRSSASFSLEPHEGGQAIRFGLASVKNVGAGIAEGIIAARATEGPFVSSYDFFHRIDCRHLNKRALEALIKTGAFDGLDTLSDGQPANRDDLMASLDRLTSLAQHAHRARELGQGSLFDVLEENEQPQFMAIDRSTDETPQSQRLAEEKELLGVYLSEHPFSRAADDLSPFVTPLREISKDMAGQTAIISGLVAFTRSLMTKDGRDFLAATLEDLSESLEVTIWPETYERTQELWWEGNIVVAKVRFRARGDQLDATVVTARLYEEGIPFDPSTLVTTSKRNKSNGRQEGDSPTSRWPPDELSGGAKSLAGTPSLHITLLETADVDSDQRRLRDLMTILRDHEGHDFTHLTIRHNNGEEVDLELPSAHASPQLKESIAKVVGEWGSAELT